MSVGQKIWGVTVVAIKNDRVVLKDEIGKFEVKNGDADNNLDRLFVQI